MTAAPRYTVRTDMPEATQALGFVACVDDARHPDDPRDGASCCWCQDLDDAERIADGLNRDELFRERLRDLIVEGAVGVTKAPGEMSTLRDAAPLTIDELQHLTWLASSCTAVPLLTKPQLARLLDDRARLIVALRNLAEFRPSIRDEIEELLARVVG
jgi:hypothetical protein